MIISRAVTPKRSYAKISKNAKLKGIVKVVNTESHQKSPNRVTSINVEAFEIDATNITNNRKLRMSLRDE